MGLEFRNLRSYTPVPGQSLEVWGGEGGGRLLEQEPSLRLFGKNISDKEGMHTQVKSKP